MKKKIVIIGGGYGGLATANLFAKKGDEVIVIEKNTQLGGRAGQLEQGGFRFDTGPSWYLMPEVFAHYYSLFDMDVADELSLTRLAPGYKVFFENDTPITLMGDLEGDAATLDALEPGAGKMIQRYVSDSTKIYDLSVQHILYNTYQNLRWIFQKEVIAAAPRLLPMLITPLDTHVRRFFKDSRIQRVLEYHSVFLGTSPYEAPAIYSLMSTLDFKSGVYYPKNGMYSMVESLARLGESLGVTYRTDVAVSSIDVVKGEATGVTLSNQEHIVADVVISAADLYHTETQLLAPPYQSYPEKYWRKKQAGPSALLLSLGVRGSLPNLEHHNLYFVDNWRDNFTSIYKTQTIPEHASIYICKPSATDPTAAPEGHENIFILVPLPSGLELSETDKDALVDRAIRLLGDMADTPDIADRIVTRDIVIPQTFTERFNAWRFNALGGQSHLLTQSAFFRTKNKSKKVKNLYYVGAGTNPGIGLPMCLMSAQLVYKMVHGLSSVGPVKEIVRNEDA